jgi:hypothetical protein
VVVAVEVAAAVVVEQQPKEVAVEVAAVSQTRR